MKRTRQKSEQVERTHLVYGAQVLLAKPAVVGHWRAALERANEFTALLGMKPDIRHKDGYQVVEEGYTSAMGARFSFTLPGDARLTPGQAQAIINGSTLEEALQRPVDEEDAGRWLAEDELTQLLEALQLTEGWKC